jgi:sugar lactone lactonase YvrE
VHSMMQMSRQIVLLMLLLAFVFAAISTRADTIDFDSDRWVIVNGRVVEHLGRKSLLGTAYLREVDFQDGVIEVDIAASWDRSYPGINFRIQSPRDYERLYIRPHRMKFNDDALQYTPAINGISGWQLYSGDGFTAPCEIPYDQWVHIRLEVKGTQARVFVGEGEQPDLLIHDLKHGRSHGTIGLEGMTDGTSYFSNFSYCEGPGLKFDPPPIVDTPAGMVMDWEISQPFTYTKVDFETYPEDQKLGKLTWQRVAADRTGLVDVARYRGRTGREPDCVFARAVIPCDEEGIREIRLGYSDAVSAFFNGRLVFSGNSSYRSRDPSFLGVVGLFDAIHVPFQRGDNEILLAVIESFGGWGFMAQDASVVFLHDSVSKLWETPAELLTPESVVYDPERNVYYVSNYDQFNPSMGRGRQSISKISADGEILAIDWIAGINNPTGMVTYDDKLMVVERGGLVEIDLAIGGITDRFPIADVGMPNDITVDGSGNFYVTDSGKNVIYRFSTGEFEEWLGGPEVSGPNGLVVDDGTLVWGNNGDNCLKSADIATGEVKTIVNLGSGIIDGVKLDGHGGYLVSHWQGKVYKVSPSGNVVKILDTTGPGDFAADFESIPEGGLIVIPTFLKNKVAAYRVRL